MTRILLVASLTAGMVVFGSQNWGHVPISLLFGGPTKIRLVFLLAIALGAGYVTAVLRSASREMRLRRELRELRRLLHDVAESEPLVEPEPAPVERRVVPRPRRRRIGDMPAAASDLDAFDTRESEA